MANLYSFTRPERRLNAVGAFTGDESSTGVSVLGATDGINLAEGVEGVRGISATLIMDAAGTIGSGAVLDWYYQEPQTSTWVPLPAKSVNLTGGNAGEATVGFDVPNPTGRLAALPRTVGANCHIYLNATQRRF